MYGTWSSVELLAWRYNTKSEKFIFSQCGTGILGKRKSKFSNRVKTRICDLPFTSSDALSLSYRSLVGAKAIKLGSWDKYPAYSNILHTARIGMSCGTYDDKRMLCYVMLWIKSVRRITS